MRLKGLLIGFAIILAFSQIEVMNGYSVWGETSKDVPESIGLGGWDDITPWDQVALDLKAFVDSNTGNDPDLADIYSQSGKLNKSTPEIHDISIDGVVWNIVGAGSNNPPTAGFIQVVDRSVINGNPVHSILPPAPSGSDPYEHYDYFKVYDAMNTLTNNNYSIRLNYNVTMQTDQLIQGLTQVSFYASRGLISPDDIAPMDDTRQLRVHVSTNGTNWTKIGEIIMVAPSSEESEFGFYSFDIPSKFEGEDLYVRIKFIGKGKKVDGVRTYSRAILDELTLVTS